MIKLYSQWLQKAAVATMLLTISLCSFGKAVTVTKDGVKYKSDKNQKYLMVVNAPYKGEITVADSVYIESAGKKLPVTQVGSSAFSELDELTSVSLPNTITKIGDYAFDSSENLTTVNMGESVETIGHWAFRNCKSLEELKFPETLQTIGNYCFDKNLKITEVHIPASVTLIGGYAFEGNPDLKNIYSYATTPPEVKKGYLDGEEIYTLFDDNDYADRVLWVPAGTVDDYKLTYGWHQFKVIREMESTGIDNVEAEYALQVATAGKGAISVTAAKPATIKVFDISGREVAEKHIGAGTSTIGGLSSGIVIVNGKKVVVK